MMHLASFNVYLRIAIIFNEAKFNKQVIRPLEVEKIIFFLSKGQELFAISIWPNFWEGYIWLGADVKLIKEILGL